MDINFYNKVMEEIFDNVIGPVKSITTALTWIKEDTGFYERYNYNFSSYDNFKNAIINLYTTFSEEELEYPCGLVIPVDMKQKGVGLYLVHPEALTEEKENMIKSYLKANIDNISDNVSKIYPQ